MPRDVTDSQDALMDGEGECDRTRTGKDVPIVDIVYRIKSCKYCIKLSFVSHSKLHGVQQPVRSNLAVAATTRTRQKLAQSTGSDLVIIHTDGHVLSCVRTAAGRTTNTEITSESAEVTNQRVVESKNTAVDHQQKHRIITLGISYSCYLIWQCGRLIE